MSNVQYYTIIEKHQQCNWSFGHQSQHGAVARTKEQRRHRRGKHIECKYHLIRQIVCQRDVVVAKILSTVNLEDSS
jgi:hypothetical protein